ncbi:MAG: hypothetical protein M3Q07_11325, partial [Pseudobdellovibrionaceae bacterium]|nr:hypothetical protein [Pseudobdellovibrionaceae bacterium]
PGIRITTEGTNPLVYRPVLPEPGKSVLVFLDIHRGITGRFGRDYAEIPGILSGTLHIFQGPGKK